MVGCGVRICPCSNHGVRSAGTAVEWRSIDGHDQHAVFHVYRRVATTFARKRVINWHVDGVAWHLAGSFFMGSMCLKHQCSGRVNYFVTIYCACWRSKPNCTSAWGRSELSVNGEATNSFHHNIVNRDASSFNCLSKVNAHFVFPESFKVCNG